MDNLQEMQEIVEQVVADREQEVTCRWIGVRGPQEDPRETVEGGVR